MDTNQQFREEKINPLAILCYIGILVLIPLLFEKEDEFVKFHTKQGLALFLAEVATLFISWIPLIGWLIGFVLSIVWILLSIGGIINVLSGKKKPLPFLGGFAERFKV